MNKNTQIIIGIVVLVVVIGGLYASNKSNDNTMMIKEQMEQKTMEDTQMAEKDAMTEESMMKNDSMMNKGDTMMKDDSMMNKGDTMMKDNSMMNKGDTMVKAGSYEAYASGKVAMASATQDVVLFFKANWCPSCIAVDKNIKANLDKIPSGLSILDVNYDNSSDLKKKYGVTYQHTFVQVDKDGNLIKKWSGSPTLSALVAEVQ
jgi:thiol-disulfide isomerase/thioredoxin